MNKKWMIALMIGTSAWAAWADTETTLPDGRKIVLTNKSCSACPDPAIKMVDANGKLLAQLPAKEKAMVYDSAVLQKGRYFVTMTTGGEGMLRVYDLDKKLMSGSALPFGNNKTWGYIHVLGDSEFAIVSGALSTYIKDGPKQTRLVRYAVTDGKLNELSRVNLDTDSIETLQKTADGTLLAIENKHQVSEYTVDGKLLRAARFDKHAKVMDLRPLKDGFVEVLLSVGSQYMAAKVTGSGISHAPLPKADELMQLEMKKGNNSYAYWSTGSFPVRYAGAPSTDIQILKQKNPTNFSSSIERTVIATVADAATLAYQNAEIESKGPVLSTQLGRYSDRGWPVVTRTITFTDGAMYEGDMEADPSGATEFAREMYTVQTGQGVIRWANGEQYEGEWHQGQRTGRGRYRWPNGDYHDGQWLLNKRQGYGEQESANGKVIRGLWSNDQLTSKCTRDDECLALSGNVKFERQVAAVVPVLSGAACAAAVVPNPYPQPNESSDYYGACVSGMATTGVVIWKVRGEPVSMGCLSQGVYVSRSTVDAFEACKPYLPMIPNYCSVGGYVGQCLDGKPQGVGYMASRGSTISMKSGMFSSGKLHGYGYEISKSGCGMAGCSGNLLYQTGWFDADVLQTSCANFADCMKSISGKTFSNYLSAPKSKALLDEAERLRSLKTFDGALEAFQIAGDRNDLRAAQTLAQGSIQKSELELILLRIAGLNKVFDLQARIQIGKRSVPINEHENLLGFVRGVDSSLPVKVIWSVGSGNAAMNPRVGPYRMTVTVGLNVKTSNTSCFLGFCSTRQDVDRYVKTIEPVLSEGGRYKASGEFELTLSGASAGTMFGVSSGKTLEDILPVMQIESIRVDQ